MCTPVSPMHSAMPPLTLAQQPVALLDLHFTPWGRPCRAAPCALQRIHLGGLRGRGAAAADHVVLRGGLPVGHISIQEAHLAHLAGGQARGLLRGGGGVGGEVGVALIDVVDSCLQRCLLVGAAELQGMQDLRAGKPIGSRVSKWESGLPCNAHRTPIATEHCRYECVAGIAACTTALHGVAAAVDGHG